MGQKVNPTSFRLAINKNWQSRWYAGREYRSNLSEDIQIREALNKKLTQRSGVARIDIERSTGTTTLTIHTSRPGVVIGRGGSGTTELRAIIAKIVPGDVKLNIEEIKKAELNAELIAANIANQLERRIAFRRAMRATVENAMKEGALGIKIKVAGRLNGAEMARTETLAAGSIPLHTLRAPIDYGTAQAWTSFGVIGVKVWVYKKEEN